ncbi:hypothetical protein SAMN06297358_0787 [Pedobacter xixiisoli]|uniref:Uncharacterized protein n=1 Tax=Pedobacter xixiisoli TaxID=1476464 RepID=A0A285ZSM9_9SPHI|nr:hypothetical protein SAMN06297358_0787 [Pedobacter xixiisoli]
MVEGLEEIYAQIIKDSAKRLRVVKMLSNFFNHKDLFAVYIRTKVIHNLFESNKNLDINKLELFHIQYTSSLIELFQKLKKSKEQQYLLITDEIYINDDLIKKLEQETEGSNFQIAAKKHGTLMSSKLREIYTMLDAGTASPTFGWGDIMVFSARKGKEFFRELPGGEAFLQLTECAGKKTYQAEYAVIEKKLIGKLNKLNFRVKFACGLRFENEYVEVFDFVDSNDQFIFINSIKTFYLLDEIMSEGLDLSRNSSDKATIVFELRSKNVLLRDKLTTVKTSLPESVEEVLAGYLAKISGVDFLEELQNVDEQTNILRAMLNININTK